MKTKNFRIGDHVKVVDNELQEMKKLSYTVVGFCNGVIDIEDINGNRFSVQPSQIDLLNPEWRKEWYNRSGMTEAEFYTMGYMACIDLANALDYQFFDPKPTEEDFQAIYKARDLFACMLARTIRDKVVASEFFDNNTMENIHRYFSKANETDMIDLNIPTGEEEKTLIAEACKRPKKDMPFWLRMVKALRNNERNQDE